jgi:hypothetical protein
MFSLFVSVLSALCSSFRTQAALQLENLALRHHINVLRRSQRGRVHLRTADRLFWTWLMHFWSGWHSALAIVKPETVIAWHRKGFRLYWTWKSRHGQPGRAALAKESRELIRRMSLANPLGGAPRIHGGTAQTRNRCVPGNRSDVRGAHTEAAISHLANLPQQSRHPVRFDKLRGADFDHSDLVCLRRPRPPRAPGSSFQLHRQSDFRMDSTPNRRRFSLGHRTALSAAPSRLHPWRSVSPASARDRCARSPDGPEVALAESVCGATAWIDLAGVSGS